MCISEFEKPLYIVIYASFTESKASKKNRKRRDPSIKTEAGAAVEERVMVSDPPRPPADPLSQLKSQLAQAKADKVRRECVCVCVYPRVLAWRVP